MNTQTISVKELVNGYCQTAACCSDNNDEYLSFSSTTAIPAQKQTVTTPPVTKAQVEKAKITVGKKPEAEAKTETKAEEPVVIEVSAKTEPVIKTNESERKKSNEADILSMLKAIKG